QHAGPVEVVQIVHGVGDVIRDIHDRTFDGLLVRTDARVLGFDLLHLVGVESVCRKLGGTIHGIDADSARQLWGWGNGSVAPVVACPRVFEHGSPHCHCQVKAAATRVTIV